MSIKVKVIIIAIVVDIAIGFKYNKVRRKISKSKRLTIMQLD